MDHLVEYARSGKRQDGQGSAPPTQARATGVKLAQTEGFVRTAITLIPKRPLRNWLSVVQLTFASFRSSVISRRFSAVLVFIPTCRRCRSFQTACDLISELGWYADYRRSLAAGAISEIGCCAQAQTIIAVSPIRGAQRSTDDEA